MDTKSLVRRQELLSRARRARHDWLEGCRAKRLLRPELSTTEKWSLRRECEVEVIEESAVGIFGSAGQMTRFLSEVIDDEPNIPLVPLAGDDDWCRAVDRKVERKCKVLVTTDTDDSDAAERKEEAEIDALIERLKHPDFADVVRSTQHFVDALRRDDDDDDDDEDEDDGPKKNPTKKRGKIAAELLQLGGGEKGGNKNQDDLGAAAAEDDEEEEMQPVITELNFTTARGDPASLARVKRVEAFAKRVVATMDAAEDVSRVAAETLLFRRLAPKFFGPLSDDEEIAKKARREDEFLERRLGALHFLDFKHLGAPSPTDRKAFDDGARFLESLHLARAPADATRRLKLAARRFAKASNNGSDDLLPYFVVGLVQTKPPRLASVGNFLAIFVDSAASGKKKNENDEHQDAFVLTNVLGAIDFLANLQPASLNNVQDKLALQKQLDVAAKATHNTNNTKDTAHDSKDPLLPSASRRPGRREVSAREVRALRLARHAENAVRASALAGTFDLPSSNPRTMKTAGELLTDYQSLLAQVDAISAK